MFLKNKQHVPATTAPHSTWNAWQSYTPPATKAMPSLPRDPWAPTKDEEQQLTSPRSSFAGTPSHSYHGVPPPPPGPMYLNPGKGSGRGAPLPPYPMPPMPYQLDTKFLSILSNHIRIYSPREKIYMKTFVCKVDEYPSRPPAAPDGQGSKRKEWQSAFGTSSKFI